MPNERTGQSEIPFERRPLKNAIIVTAILLVVAFLAGFLPQYAKANRLENDLRASKHENSVSQLRDLTCLVYFQASQKDYGLAAATSTRFFDHTREVADQAQDDSERKSLEEILKLRDKITTELAKGDPAVLPDLQAVFVKTREATGAAPAK